MEVWCGQRCNKYTIWDLNCKNEIRKIGAIKVISKFFCSDDTHIKHRIFIQNYPNFNNHNLWIKDYKEKVW